MMALTSAQMEELRRILERERAKLVRRLQRFGADREDVETKSFSQHMAEDASTLTERETAYLLASEEGRRLVAVNKALDRLLHKPLEFGRCMGCEAEVSFDRLEAVPYTELCIGCKRAEEERGSGSRD
jgi:DnaK suppressor protein